jgi:hypothetical protein
MKPLRTLTLVPLGIALMIGAAAARDRPEAELAVAHAALDDARRAYAVQYAPVDYDAARSKLEAADQAATKRDYDHARRLAFEAEADARLANVRAQAAVAQQGLAQVQLGLGTMQQGLPAGSPGDLPPPPMP